MPIGDDQWIQEQLAQLQQQPAAMPTGTPDDGTRPSWTGLLGSVLSGGQAPGYKLRGGEADTAGNKALLNFGINMLLASGPAPVRPDLLSAAATGLQGAQQSIDVDQQRAQAAALAQQGYAEKQQTARLAALKEALPLLKLQQEAKALAALKGGATSTAAGPGGGGAGTYEGSVLATEGTGRNPRSTAEGHGQFLESTWQGFVAANPTLFANMSPAQILAARNDPEMGAKATTWLAQQNAPVLQAAGVPPSGVSLRVAHYLGAGPAAKVMQAPDNAPVAGFVSPEAVKANPELATMTAGQLRQRYANTPDPAFLRPTQTAQGPATPAAPGGPPAAPGAPLAPPSVQVGGPAPPPPGGPSGPSGPPSPGAGGMAQALPPSGAPTTVLRETQERGPGGQVRTVVRPMPATPPPTAGAPPPAQVSANVGAILGGMDRAATATPASAMPMVGGPGAGPSAQPLPPVEAGWGAGNRATGYGGGSPPPGMVAPPVAPVVAPGAAPVAPVAAPPAMSVPPPFAMRPLTPSEAAATSYDLDPATKAGFAQRLQVATTVAQAEAVKKDEAAAIEARRKEADAARLTIEATARKDWLGQTHPTTEQELAASGLRREPNVLYMTDNQGKVTPTAIPVDPRGVQASKDDQDRYQKNYALPYDQIRPLHSLLNEMEALKTLVERDPLGGRGGIGAEYARKLQGVLTPLGLSSDMFRDSTGAQQAYEGLSNQLILKLKAMSGTSLGQMSDRDLSFLTASGPTLMQTPLGRDMSTAALRQIMNYQAKLYDVATDTIHDAHGGYTLKDLSKKLADVPDAIPTLPGPQSSPAEAQAWKDHHKPRRGMAFYGPDGNLHLWGVPEPAR